MFSVSRRIPKFSVFFEIRTTHVAAAKEGGVACNVMLASVSSNWWQTLVGWPQSNPDSRVHLWVVNRYRMSNILMPVVCIKVNWWLYASVITHVWSRCIWATTMQFWYAAWMVLFVWNRGWWWGRNQWTWNHLLRWKLRPEQLCDERLRRTLLVMNLTVLDMALIQQDLSLDYRELSVIYDLHFYLVLFYFGFYMFSVIPVVGR